MDRKRRRKRRRRRNTGRVNYLKILCLIIVCGIIGGGAWYLAENTGDPIARYEAAQYNTNIYQGKLFADSLCVASEEVSLDGFDTEGIISPIRQLWTDFCSMFLHGNRFRAECRLTARQISVKRG